MSSHVLAMFSAHDIEIRMNNERRIRRVSPRCVRSFHRLQTFAFKPRSSPDPTPPRATLLFCKVSGEHPLNEVIKARAWRSTAFGTGNI